MSNLQPLQFGEYFHGTRQGPFSPGDILTGGYPRSDMSNQGNPPLEHVYFHSDPKKAEGYAQTDVSANYGTGNPAVYRVEPLDKPEMDPDLPAFTGNMRAKSARVISQLQWGSKELPFEHPHVQENKHKALGVKAWWED